MSCPYLYSCFRGSQPSFESFCWLEVDPVEVLFRDHGVEYLGVCNDPTDKPVIWTIYGRYANGEVIAITDRPSESSAWRIAEYFERRFGVNIHRLPRGVH